MSFLKGNVVLVAYPFSDLSAAKVRPAVVVSSHGDKYPFPDFWNGGYGQCSSFGIYF
jgi:hypothetical protein